MKFYEVTPEKDNPLRVFGLLPFYDGEGFSKCHREILEKIPRIAGLGHRSCGGRVCFRTDSPSFTVRMTLERVSVDIGIPMFGASSADVCVGPRPEARFLGLVYPTEYSDKETTVERTFYKSAETEDVTVILPRNETVVSMSIGIEENAQLLPPTPYRNERPVVFYGSSITEGGCPTRVGCNYVSLLSNRLNLDVINYGFSGNARGELVFAEYLIRSNPSILVYDYDHNAPTPEWLAETHEPFFLKIREACPELPVLMMTRPDFAPCEDHERRRAVVRKTYENALARGDKNVRFLDGGTFFPEEKRYECTVDACHPNDMGFSYMADAAAPVLLDFLGK